MAVTNQEFQNILDHIDITIKDTIAAEFKKLPNASAAPPDLDRLKTTIQGVITDELATLRNTPPQQPEKPPNPLAFYETILKVRSHHNVSHDYRTHTFPKPYFADVFNDVMSYFGGINTTDPIGRRFLEEATKRFAYLRGHIPDGRTDSPFLYQGQMSMFSEFAINEHGWQIGFPLPYGGREFAILREILEEIFKEETPLPNEPPRTQQPTITTDELAAKLTSFRETLLTDIQNYIRTDKKEKELDKAFTTMQATLETIQKTRGKPYGDNSQQLSPPEDPTFQF